ncbi:MAG: virulence RhuM family protein [Selenomonas sp.]|nr:virulence RhuM family protein [Selenomonas sp.]
MADKQMQFLLYKAKAEQVTVNALIKDDNIWLTQKAMGTLFDCSISNISLHLKNIYDEGELDKEATVEEISIVAQEGQRSVNRDENQIKRLERAVTGYFDYIEDLIENEQAFTMEQFAESINAFLEFRRYKILTNKGSISKKQADAKAIEEYNEFNKHQRIDSDFDKTVRKMLERGET